MTALKVLSLNCYLLPENPLHRWCPAAPGKQDPKQNMNRLQDICDNILGNDYDVVCLQEVWMEKYKDQFVLKLAKRYPHYTWNRSGFFGSGLMTFSVLPIKASFFRPFLLNDRIFPFGSLDSTCGKGLTVSTVEKDGILIAVVNTHPQSELIKDSKDEVRLHQLWEIASICRFMGSLSDVIVLCGDLNAVPDFLGIKLLREVAHLQDTFSLDDAPKRLLATYACPDNELVEKDYQEKFSSGIRIDYIFVSPHLSATRGALGSSQGANRKQLTAVCDVTIRPWDLFGTCSKLPFSDHEAVEAKITWKETTNSKEPNGADFQGNLSEKAASSVGKFFQMAEKQSEKAKKRVLRWLFVSYFCAIIVCVLRLIDFSFDSILSQNSSLAILVADGTITVSVAVFCYSFYSYFYHGCASSAFKSAADGLAKISKNYSDA